MDDAMLMGIVDGHADGSEESNDVGTWAHFCGARCASQGVRKCIPLYILCQKTGHRGYRASGISRGEDEHVEETHKIGMLKGSNSFCLAEEMPDDLGVHLVMRVENLQDDIVLRLGIVG